MKKQDKKKIKDSKVEELKKRLEEELVNATKLKMQLKTGKLKDLHSYSKKRKEIAALKTILKEKVYVESSAIKEEK